MSTPAWFNKEYYLHSKLAQLVASGDSSYADIVALDVAIEAAGYDAFSHFQAFSLVERTSPNQYFNAGEYLTAKAAQANATEAGGRTDWTADGIALASKDAGIATIWDHFAKYGWAENVNPSNAFDVSDYFADKLAQLQADEPSVGWTDASMKAAFAAAGLDPVTHFLSFGVDEGFFVSPVPAGEQVSGGTSTGLAPQAFTLTTSADAANEGSTLIFTLTTTNVAAGTTYNYVISGVDANDIQNGQLTGSTVIGADGKAYVQLVLANDAVTEGAETLTLSVAGETVAVLVNDTSLSVAQQFTTSAQDNLMGTAQDDVMQAEVTDSLQASASNTLSGGDRANGLDGNDTVVLTAIDTAADGPAIAVGFQFDNIENFEVRSYDAGGEDGVLLSLVNVNGLENIISTNSTAGIQLTSVNSMVNLDLTSNGTGEIDVSLKYLSDAVAGVNTQTITLNNFEGDALVVGDADGNAIENLEITTTGKASEINYLASYEVSKVTITGDQDLSIGYLGADSVLSIQGFVGGTASLSLGGASLGQNATVTTGDGDDSLELSANGDGSTTVNVGNGDNYVYISEDSSLASISVTAGSGNDDLTVTNLDSSDETNVTVNAGAGVSNYVNIGEDAFDVTATATGGDNTFDIGNVQNNLLVTTGAGDDTLNLNDAYQLTVNAGDGDNTISAGDITTLAEVTTGTGDDEISVGSAENATILAGDGDNIVNVGSVTDITTVITGAGNDEVDVGIANIIDVQLGDGNNTVYTDYVNDGAVVSVTAGSGNDEAYIGGGDIVDVRLGDGDNTVWFGQGTAGDVTVVTGAGTDTVNLREFGDFAPEILNLTLGDGDDTATLSGDGLEKYDGISAYVAAGYTIAGGDGADNLVASNLYNVDAAGTFANVTSVETLTLDQGEDSSFNGGALDGLTTGANAAGVMTYDLVDTLYEDAFTLSNISAGATVKVNYDYWTDTQATISLADTGALNLHVRTSDEDGNGNLDLDIANVSTLNFSVQDTDIDITNENPAVQYFYSSNFYADAALTTLNITDTTDTATYPGEGVEIGFDDIWAENLATISAGGMTQALNLVLNNVADTGVTITSGSGDDVIVLSDAASSMNVTTGAGDDYVEATSSQTQGNTVDTGDGDDEVNLYGSGNDLINTGDGDDRIFSGAGVDTIDAGAGDDTINFNAADLTAADLVDGGEGTDEIVLDGSLGTVDDNFFRQWNSVETLKLDAGNNNLTLGWIAQNDAQLKTVYLSDDGMGWGDRLNFTDDFTGAIDVHLSNGEDTINTSAVQTRGPSAINVYAEDSQVWWDDYLQGGNGIDTLFLEATNGAAYLHNVTNFEQITVQVVTAGQNIDIIVGSDSVVENTKTLTVDASALVDVLDSDDVLVTAAGELYFDGSDESGTGAFIVTGGDGDDTIYTGNGNDTIAAGAGDNVVYAYGGGDTITAADGDNYVEAGDGDDTITLGNGRNIVHAGTGDDVITTGTGNDTILGGDGDDSIAAGNGVNAITGGAGADRMSGGTGVDTYLFNAASESSGITSDIITGFTGAIGAGGAAADVIDLGGVAQAIATANGTAATVTVNFIGNLSNATVANTALPNNSLTTLNVVYVTGEKFLYVDANQNGVIDTGDMSIELVGLVGTLTSANFAGFGV